MHGFSAFVAILQLLFVVKYFLKSSPKFLIKVTISDLCLFILFKTPIFNRDILHRKILLSLKLLKVKRKISLGCFIIPVLQGFLDFPWESLVLIMDQS